MPRAKKVLGSGKQFSFDFFWGNLQALKNDVPETKIDLFFSFSVTAPRGDSHFSSGSTSKTAILESIRPVALTPKRFVWTSQNQGKSKKYRRLRLPTHHKMGGGQLV